MDSERHVLWKRNIVARPGSTKNKTASLIRDSAYRVASSDKEAGIIGGLKRAIQRGIAGGMQDRVPSVGYTSRKKLVETTRKLGRPLTFNEEYQIGRNHGLKMKAKHSKLLKAVSKKLGNKTPKSSRIKSKAYVEWGKSHPFGKTFVDQRQRDLKKLYGR